MDRAVSVLAVLTVILASSVAAWGLSPANAAGLGVEEAVPSGLPWYFVAIFGDNRPADTSSTELPRPFHEILEELSVSNPFAVIGTGDHTGEGRRDQIEVFINSVSRLSNVWVVAGNHDYRGDRDYWAENVAPDFYYRDDIPGWRIVFLNSEARPADMLSFANATLKTSRHKIVVIHRPLEPYVNHNLGPLVKNLLKQILEETNVSLVLQGHWHGYAEARVGGIHYVIVGGGGAPLYSYGDYPSVYSYAYLVMFPNGTYTLIPLSLEGGIRVDVEGDTVVVENTKLDVYGNPATVPVRVRVETEDGLLNIVLLAPPGTVDLRLTGNACNPVESNASLIYYTYYEGKAPCTVITPTTTTTTTTTTTWHTTRPTTTATTTTARPAVITTTTTTTTATTESGSTGYGSMLLPVLLAVAVLAAASILKRRG